MIDLRVCINVYSEVNPHIDMCVLLFDDDESEVAMEIIQMAYDDWWEFPDELLEPIADYISGRLLENGIRHEIFYKESEDD